jgi:hypothetical protein
LAGPEGGLATTRLVGSVSVLVVAAGTVNLTVLSVAALTIALELASDTILGRLRFFDRGLRIVGRFRGEATQLLHALLIMIHSLLYEMSLRIYEALRQF